MRPRGRVTPRLRVVEQDCASPASSPGWSPSPQPVDGSSAHVLVTTSRVPRPPDTAGHRRVSCQVRRLRRGWQALRRWRASQQPKATYDHPRHDGQSQQGEGAGLQESSLTVSFTHLSPSTRRPASPVRRSEGDVHACGHARISTMTASARISLRFQHRVSVSGPFGGSSSFRAASTILRLTCWPTPGEGGSHEPQGRVHRIAVRVPGVAADGGGRRPRSPAWFRRTHGFVAGAPGVGDPYFPLAGNGGYDVKHYLLDLDYDPATDVLSGTATITAAATKNLSRFNLDLDGLTVRSIKVDGRSAHWSRDGGELTVTPSAGPAEPHSLHHRGDLRRRSRDAW